VQHDDTAAAGVFRSAPLRRRSARAVHFDGRDVAELIAPGHGTGREIALCHYCGTVRDARFAFCCEFAMSWDSPKAAAPVTAPVVYTSPAAPRVAVVSAA
jgi:hypothetical protein